jgi:hypothetical protein
MTGTEVEGKIFLLNLHISSTSSGLSAIVPPQKKKYNQTNRITKADMLNERLTTFIYTIPNDYPHPLFHNRNYGFFFSGT